MGTDPSGPRIRGMGQQRAGMRKWFGSAPKNRRAKAVVTRTPVNALEASLQAAVRTGDHVEGLAEILRLAVDDLGVTGGFALIPDEFDSGTLLAQCAYSPDGEFPFPEAIAAHHSVSGQVISTRQPVMVRGSEFTEAQLQEFGHGVLAVLSVPLLGRSPLASFDEVAEVVHGTLTLVSTDSASAFDAECIRRAESFAHIYSLTYASLRSERYRRTTLVDCLEQICVYIESKDRFRAGHSSRTGRIATELANELGLGAKAIEELRIACTVMDLGYISIPDTILQKPDQLTDYEFLMMRMHPVVSYELCQKLQIPDNILALVRGHHERLDGSGYPDQLSNNEITLQCRILTVADAYDSMRCPRAHRAGMTEEESMKQLLLDAGSRFDPVVVQTLRTLIEKNQFSHLYDDMLAA